MVAAALDDEDGFTVEPSVLQQYGDELVFALDEWSHTTTGQRARMQDQDVADEDQEQFEGPDKTKRWKKLIVKGPAFLKEQLLKLHVNWGHPTVGHMKSVLERLVFQPPYARLLTKFLAGFVP